MRTDAAASKQQIAEVRTELTEMNQRLAAFETNLRLAAFETNRKQAKRDAGLQTLPPEQIKELRTAISQCVQAARDEAPKDALLAKFYLDFDAFYNPASGRVQNNNVYHGGLPAVYAFNKCMALQGFPLT